MKVVFRNNHRYTVIWRHPPLKDARPSFCLVADDARRRFGVLLQRQALPCGFGGSLLKPLLEVKGLSPQLGS